MSWGRLSVGRRTGPARSRHRHVGPCPGIRVCRVSPLSLSEGGCWGSGPGNSQIGKAQLPEKASLLLRIQNAYPGGLGTDSSWATCSHLTRAPWTQLTPPHPGLALLPCSAPLGPDGHREPRSLHIPPWPPWVFMRLGPDGVPWTGPASPPLPPSSPPSPSPLSPLLTSLPSLTPPCLVSAGIWASQMRLSSDPPD